MKKLTPEAVKVKDDFYADISEDVERDMITIAFALSVCGIRRNDVSNAALRALADLDDKIKALPNNGLMPDDDVPSGVPDLRTMTPVGKVN